MFNVKKSGLHVFMQSTLCKRWTACRKHQVLNNICLNSTQYATHSTLYRWGEDVFCPRALEYQTIIIVSIWNVACCVRWNPDAVYN